MLKAKAHVLLKAHRHNHPTYFFYGYVVVLAAFFILCVMWGAMYSFGAFLKPMSAEFGWTRVAISGAYSLNMVLHGLLYIVAGKINDSFGPRRVIVVCGFLAGLGYLLMSQISAIWQLYLFYGVIIGVAMSGSYVPLTSTIAKWFVKRRGLMTGIGVSGIGLGTTIIPPIAIWFISNYDWRASYIIIGSITLVLVILSAQFLRCDPSQVGQLPYGEGTVRKKCLNLEACSFSFWEAICTKQFWMLGAVYVSFGFCVQTIMVHIVPYATDFGMPKPCAATVLAIIGGLSIAGRIMIGSAIDRIGNKQVIIICFIFMSIALLCLLAAKEWMLYLFGAIFGFAYGGIVTIQSPILAELFGLSSHGAILGVISFSSTLGSAIGPVLAGWTFDVTGSYNQVFLVCATMAVIGLILTLFLAKASMEEVCVL